VATPVKEKVIGPANRAGAPQNVKAITRILVIGTVQAVQDTLSTRSNFPEGAASLMRVPSVERNPATLAAALLLVRTLCYQTRHRRLGRIATCPNHRISFFAQRYRFRPVEPRSTDY
jgi:hypothetical protein